MKTIGLIGGTSWLSTSEYYRIINQEVNRRLGGHNSAKILLHSVNMQEFLPPAEPSGWKEIGERLADIALRLERAGAECLLLCSNTPHTAAGAIQSAIGIPFFHIAEAAAKAIERKGIPEVGMLGTKQTMEGAFFRDKLQERGIRMIVPDARDRDFIHESIFRELAKDAFLPETKRRYVEVIGKLRDQGAGGVILGCTEIPLLLTQDDSPIPVFNTTAIHAMEAVGFALND
jgi:aspartate racemase